MSLTTILARAAATRAGFRLINALARPARDLFDRDGSCYMRRWRIVDEGTLASRVLQALTGYSSIRLHHILKADHDRDLHNHPFDYRTFVLRGFYAETYKDGRGNRKVQRRVVEPGEAAALPGVAFHRIAYVPPGGVWTLFCMTRNTGTWGFNVDGKFVPSTTYLLRKGYTQGAQTL